MRVAVVVLLAATLYLDCLGTRDLWSSHEARAAQNAQSIFLDGNWLTPTLLDHQVELQKPPAFYWLAAACGRLAGGVDAWCVRLPAALSGVGVLACVAFYLRRRPTAALVAVLTLATAPHFVLLCRTGRIDMPLTLAVTVALLTDRPIPRGVALGVGLLLKGPIAVVLPVAAWCCDRTVPKRWWQSLLIAAVVAAPWFADAHFRTSGAFTREFFIHHHLDRVEAAKGLSGHPWHLYLTRWAVDWLPWSVLIPVVAWQARRADRELRFGLAWCVGMTLLLSLSKFKRADYLAPAYPGFAIALGCALEPLPWRRLVYPAAAACVVGWLVYIHHYEPQIDADRQRRDAAALVRQHAPPPRPVLLFRVEDHLLSWHLGRPLNTFKEWENLAVWATQPEPVVVLMPEDAAAVWEHELPRGRLERLATVPDTRDRPLAVMRTVPP